MGAGRASLIAGEPDHVSRGEFGRYELVAPLAAGGMATVYLGRVRGLGGFERLVAIKCCHAHLATDPEFVSRFLDEARLAAQIHHPNVVPTLDVGDTPRLFLVMEYVDGERLFGLIAAAAERDELVPLAITLRVLVDTLRGLHAAHELRDRRGRPLNLVHRDVTPQNILVGVDGVTRLTDFGIAKADARLTVTGDADARGKLSYMPAEQLSGGEVDRRADIYAAGVVLWEALTGLRLFAGQTPQETLARVLSGVVQPPSSHVTDLPPEIDRIVARALSREARARYGTAAEFADAIESSGVPLASAREVGDYVERVAAPTLAARRAALAEPSLEPDAIAPQRATSGEISPPTTEHAPGAAASPSRRGRLRLLLALLAVLASVAAGLGALAARRAREPTATAPARTVVSPSKLPGVIAPPPTPAAVPREAPVSAAAHVAPSRSSPGTTARRQRRRSSTRRTNTSTAPARASGRFVPPGI